MLLFSKISKIGVEMEMFYKLQSFLFLENATFLVFNLKYNYSIETQAK